MPDIKYLIRTKVIEVREQFDREYISGHGYDAKFGQKSRGWFVYFQGSYEALHVGAEKPDLKEGDDILITIERTNASR